MKKNSVHISSLCVLTTLKVFLIIAFKAIFEGNISTGMCSVERLAEIFRGPGSVLSMIVAEAVNFTTSPWSTVGKWSRWSTGTRPPKCENSQGAGRRVTKGA